VVSDRASLEIVGLGGQLLLGTPPRLEYSRSREQAASFPDERLQNANVRVMACQVTSQSAGPRTVTTSRIGDAKLKNKELPGCSQSRSRHGVEGIDHSRSEMIFQCSTRSGQSQIPESEANVAHELIF
jgi:hypothetical protein